MGKLSAPTAGELIFYFVLFLLGFLLLPLIWIAIILFGLKRVVLRDDSIKSIAKDTGVALLFAIGGPFFALFFILFQFAILTRKSLATISCPRRGGTALRGGKNSYGTFEGNISSRQPYRYQSLGVESKIRLLDICSGSINDPIRGEIVTADLSSTPAYDALSYTWTDETGDTKRSREILCVDDDSVVRITKNCEAAIRHLRLPAAKRRVWIDAVCINQDSDAERDHQVSLMSKIYVSARRIIVYTGEATRDTNLLYDWLNGLDKKEIQIPSIGIFEDINESYLGILAGAARFWNRLGAIKIWINDIAMALERLWNTAQAQFSSLLADPEPDRKIVLSNSQISQLVSNYFKRRWFKRV